MHSKATITHKLYSTPPQGFACEDAHSGREQSQEKRKCKRHLCLSYNFLVRGKIRFSGRRWLQGDWRVLPSGRSCLPRTADRRLTDSGLTLRREGGVLLHPRCQETTERPVIRPCHRVPNALSASTLEEDTLAHTFPCSKIKGTLSMTSTHPIMELLSKLMRLRHALCQQHAPAGV